MTRKLTVLKRSTFVMALMALMAAPGLTKADTAEDRLIDKLERIHLGLAAADPTKTAITLRLGDLYSERARAKAMKELEQNCTNCVAGDEDRRKALTYYEEALPQLQGTQAGRVMTQMGHLFQLLGEKHRAVQIYQNILKQNASPDTTGQAHLALGEVLFKEGNYAESLKHYQAVLANMQTGSHGLAAYRKAWAHFNLGQGDAAVRSLREILETPRLLNRSSSVGATAVDPQFLEELSRDLATFLAREGAGLNEAKEIYEKSPESSRLANTSYFAKELERLGQTSDSIAVWRFVLEREKSPRYRLEALILLAQQERALRMNDQANQDYQTALRLWPSVPECKTEGPCKELKSRLRSYILDWNRVEEKTVASDGLMKAYELYLGTFPDEKDMNLWAAQAYLGRKDHAKALHFFQKGAALAEQELASAEGADKGKLTDELESILLSEVEIAEKLEDQAKMVAVYDRYLTKSPLKKEAFAVQYQKAHLLYKNEKYDQAAVELRRLALDESGDKALRLQSANLALDTLVILKDESQIEVWGREFAQKFPSAQENFSKISRTAVLNQAVALATLGHKDNDLKAWETLQRMDLSTSSEEEKVAYYKNRMILAERLERFGDARRAADELLKIQTLSAEDKEFSLAKKSWYAELVLDFDTALKVTQTMKLEGLSPEDKSLKLALLSDLAGADSSSHLRDFLKTSKDAAQKMAVAKSLVEKSSTPLATLKELRPHFATYGEEYGYLALKGLAAEPTQKLAEELLKDDLVNNSKSAPIFERYVILGELAPLAESLASHQIRSANQNHLAADLKKRISLIESLEKVVNKAITSGDWTSQLISFETLKKESSRFYNDLLSLPLPEGLTDDEQQEYMLLLSQQATPYQIKAQDVDVKVQEFWGNQSALNAILKDFEGAKGDLRKLAQQEIEALLPWAADQVKANLQAALTMPEVTTEVPRVAEIEAVKRKVRDNPMNVDPLGELIGLEKRLGRDAVVSYLEARMSLIKDGQLFKDQTEQGGQ